jgi:hypothetical protein
MSSDLTRFSPEELALEGGAALPAKEVLSVPLLDLNIDVDLALALAAPVDLAVAANANVVLPIDASVSANVLSAGSESAAQATQGLAIDQLITGAAIAHGVQTSAIDQTAGTTDAPPDGGGVVTPPTDVDSLLAGGLLHVNANVDLDADLTAPIAGAVAANANVAAPIEAAVSANVASIGSSSVAVAEQTAIITQHIDATAEATVDQTSDISQATSTDGS